MARYYVIAGLAGMGVLVGCMFMPKAPSGAGASAELATLQLPDLDQDSQPDTLKVVTHGESQLTLQLISTGTVTHDVMTIDGRGPLRFEPEVEGQRWRLLTSDGTPLASLRLYKNERNDKALVPELIVTSGDLGKRYLFVERGFLKLDAHEVIPGFSVGMVMIGDAGSVLEAVGTARQADGTWVMPLATPISFNVALEDGRIKSLTYTSPAMKIKEQMTVGTPASKLDSFFPGRMQGAEQWVAPRYGITSKLDAPGGKVEAITISRPWQDPASSPKK